MQAADKGTAGELIGEGLRIGIVRARFNDAITSKLATVESIYQKLSDRAATIRMETLEWVVIILITLEIIITLTGR